MNVLWIAMTLLGGIWSVIIAADYLRYGGLMFSAKSFMMTLFIVMFAIGISNLIWE